MTQPSAPTRDRLKVPGRTATAASFVAAGALLAAFPVFRPWADKTGGDPADAFAANAWPLAHSAAVLGFVALALGLRSLEPRPGTDPLRDSRRAESRAWIAVAFLGPFFGAEAFALHAIGQHVLRTGDRGALEIADQFRLAPLPMTTFSVGLLALALVGGRLIALTSGSGALVGGSARISRVGGWLAGLGLVTYLPQFFCSPAVRISHGVALGAGLALIGIGMRSGSGRRVGEPAPVLSHR